MISTEKVTSVDAYIKAQDKAIIPLLKTIRETIKKAAPKAEELISYGMPAYKQDGVLVYFAACKNHIGFYPTGRGIETFKKEIAGYKNSKGAVQFPLDEPLPLDLISKMVKHRIEVNRAKAVIKKKK